ILVGWEAVRSSWATIFENTAEMRFTLSDVRASACGDLAWVTCTENIFSEVHGRLRSEEHTSELQSLAYLVCRLLLEKKKHYISYTVHETHTVLYGTLATPEIYKKDVFRSGYPYKKHKNILGPLNGYAYSYISFAFHI